MKKYISIVIFCAVAFLSLGMGVFSFNYQANLFASASAQEVEVFKDASPQDLTELQKASDGQLDHWATALDKFDGREYDYITPVRNQYQKNTCWAFAAVGAVEASILREGIDIDASQKNLDLDETIVAYARHTRDGKQDPLLLTTDDTYDYGRWNQGDTGAASAFSVMTQGYSLVKENSFHQSIDENTIKSKLEQSKYYVQSYHGISDSETAIKRAILQYGAVTFNYSAPSSDKYYDPTASSNHTSIIVGWDDSVKSSTFSPKQPKNDGAWIIKNSWGESGKEKGFYYISYDLSIGGLYVIDLAMAKDYQNIYHYDGDVTISMMKSAGQAQAAIYEAKLSSPTKQEQLKAVAISVPEDNLDVNVKIYKDLKANPGNVNDKINIPEQGEPVLDMNAHIEWSGMHTIDLERNIDIEQGEYFSIVIRCKRANGVSVPVNCSVDKYSTNDMTYYLQGQQWVNFKNSDFYADSGADKRAAKIRAITNTIPRETDSYNDLKYARVEIPNRLVYYEKGKETRPEKIDVLLDGQLLTNGEDYSLKIQNITSPGRAEITIQGNGAYNGTRTTYFEVAKAKYPPGATSDTINVYSEKKYLKDIPPPTDWKWENENQPLQNGYTQVTMTYIGEDKEFYQTTTCSLQIYKVDQTPSTKMDISAAQVDVVGNYVYTGSAIVPDVKVRLENVELYQGVDYTLDYQDNINAGSATIFVNGMGCYYGQARQTFVIKQADWPAEIPNSTIKVSRRIKNLNQVLLSCNNWAWQTPDAELNSDNFQTIAIYTGQDIDNYINTKLNITIIREPQLEIASITELRLDATSFVYDGQEKTPHIIAKDGIFDLVKGTDFEIEYENNIVAGQASVIVKGINDYTGTKELVFTISKAEKPIVENTTIRLDHAVAKLSDIQLPDDFIWENGDLEITAGRMRAKAIYIGKDAENYKTKEIYFEIISPVPQNDPKSGSLIWLAIIVPAPALLVGWIVFAIVRHRKKQWWK